MQVLQTATSETVKQNRKKKTYSENIVYLQTDIWVTALNTKKRKTLAAVQEDIVYLGNCDHKTEMGEVKLKLRGS